MTIPPPLLIAGPTASGKSHYALKRARQSGAVILNADSMQVYQELRVLTARPSEADEALVPHRLYGHVPAREAYSTGKWLRDIAGELKEAQQNQQPVILVGGTGLYFKALLEGLSPVPEIPEQIRERWRRAASELSASDLHAQLSEKDPVMAEKLSPTDPQRLVRALEVIEATGRSLAHWQAQPGEPLLRFDDVEAVVISRSREDLYSRADQRFEQMFEEGALEEVGKLAAQNLDPGLPAMRALGVPSLMAMQAGTLSREAAVEGAKQQTRNYIKRQLTWLRRNMISWNTISE